MKVIFRRLHITYSLLVHGRANQQPFNLHPGFRKSQDLEKSLSISNPRKISGPPNHDFFPGAKHEKNQGIAELKDFLGFEIDIEFSRPLFSKIRMQIKRLQVI